MNACPPMQAEDAIRETDARQRIAACAMGFFGPPVFSGGRWTKDTDAQPASPHLRVDIHDSDFAQVADGLAEAGHARSYLGYEPATYFENPDASQLVDAVGEARGFCMGRAGRGWPRRQRGGSAPASIQTGRTARTSFWRRHGTRCSGLGGLPLPQALQQDV